MQCKIVEHVFPCQLEMECKITRMKAGVIKLISYVWSSFVYKLTQSFLHGLFHIVFIHFLRLRYFFFSPAEQPYHTLKTHEWYFFTGE